MTTAAPLLPAPDPEPTPYDISALIPLIRADERERCLNAIRRIPVGRGGLTSLAYRSGHTDALAAAESAIERLPIEVSSLPLAAEALNQDRPEPIDG